LTEVEKIVELSPFNTLQDIFAQLNNINGAHGTIVVNYALYFAEKNKYDFDIKDSDLIIRPKGSEK
jgi:hypothetical protein